MGPLKLRPISTWAAPGLLVVATVIMARIVQQGGHGWGDDFALYINQARGLVEGTAPQVVADNRFAIDNSAFRDFTPIAYPWGTALALMPVIAIFGIDYSLLKLVPTAALGLSVALMWVIARRRLGALTAVVVTAVLAINPWYLWATDAVLSDLLFLAATLGVVALADRCLANGTIFLRAARSPVALAIAITVAAHIRREGVGLLLVLLAIQSAVWLRKRPVHLTPMQLARPWLWFLGTFTAAHLLFPAPIRPDLTVAAPSGPGAITRNVRWYPDALAELLGLQHIGNAPIQAFGSAPLGIILLTAFAASTTIGILWSIVRAGRRRTAIDLPLAAALLGVGVIVAMAPYHYQRYLMTVAPLVVLLATSTVNQAGRLLARGRPRATHAVASAMTIALVVPTLALHIPEVARSLRFHLTHSYTSTGPEDADTQQLWNAVIDVTDERDVVMFAQPRTMNLYTRRLSVVGNDRNVLMRRADWYAMERSSDYLQIDLTPAEAEQLGLEAVWENGRYVLWRVPDRE